MYSLYTVYTCGQMLQKENTQDDWLDNCTRMYSLYSGSIQTSDAQDNLLRQDNQLYILTQREATCSMAKRQL